MLAPPLLLKTASIAAAGCLHPGQSAAAAGKSDVSKRLRLLFFSNAFEMRE